MRDSGHLDRLAERLTRLLASRLSRRNIVSRLGVALTAAPALPLLPYGRASAETAEAELTDIQKDAQTKDDTRCTYWRYCAISGSLCTCCGGTTSRCPPGSEPSLTSWIGTCRNPDDGRFYVIAYRDCCGMAACGRCRCSQHDEASPAYRPELNNEIIWCFGTRSMQYTCSTAAIVGLAE
ncbi:MAG: methylamine dehydrogenase light chain [Thermaurantiacus tibetensis]|uniref:methylamine dehydrogenase light chain n=1 Tax=Thermaurantiacus tibetensis TaxID=2759035 RepID=UPI00188EE829|nr:methylamine dehydrogenase light chain [Thermaurantiacus tibetensis]